MNRVRRRSTLLSCAAATLLSCCAIDVASAAASNPVTLSGSYGLLVNSSFSPTQLDGGVAILGVLNLDNPESVSGSFTATFGADAQESARTFSGNLTGSYAPADDGTGSLMLSLDGIFQLKFAYVATNGGTSLRLVMINCRYGEEGCNLDRTLFSGFAKSMQSANGPGTLTGTYGFNRSVSPNPSAGVGVVSFDGSGTVTWTLTNVGAGRDDNSGEPPMTTTTLSGTYKMNSDGTGTISLVNANGQAGPTFAVVLTGGGEGFILLQTGRTDANVAFGTGHLQ
jgi:hypothetical protein